MARCWNDVQTLSGSKRSLENVVNVLRKKPSGTSRAALSGPWNYFQDTAVAPVYRTFAASAQFKAGRTNRSRTFQTLMSEYVANAALIRGCWKSYAALQSVSPERSLTGVAWTRNETALFAADKIDHRGADKRTFVALASMPTLPEMTSAQPGTSIVKLATFFGQYVNHGRHKHRQVLIRPFFASETEVRIVGFGKDEERSTLSRT